MVRIGRSFVPVRPLSHTEDARVFALGVLFFRDAVFGALRVPNGMPVRWGKSKTSNEKINRGKRRFLTNVCPQIIWR